MSVSPEVTLLTFACETGILNFGNLVLQKDFFEGGQFRSIVLHRNKRVSFINRRMAKYIARCNSWLESEEKIYFEEYNGLEIYRNATSRYETLPNPTTSGLRDGTRII